MTIAVSPRDLFLLWEQAQFVWAGHSTGCECEIHATEERVRLLLVNAGAMANESLPAVGNDVERNKP